MISQGIFFFADRLPPLVGGVEMHAAAFIKYFKQHPRFPLARIITQPKEELPHQLQPTFLFFNSGRWIEELKKLRNQFPRAFFLYRTGGNEILKAPLTELKISSHSQRQAYWATTINQTIDLLITNSVYTEGRLREVGVTTPFARFVGGVNASLLRPKAQEKNERPILFCAARFVPYKNHLLLLATLKELTQKGLSLCLRLAGDGPLLPEAKSYVQKANLGSSVQFLGKINNNKVCAEIAKSDIYIQLSGNHQVQLPGGKYLHSEGMGRSILEAITAGTFVIAGESGALPEIVTQDRGILVKLGDRKAIADEVEKSIQNLPLKKKFTNVYCWTHIFKKYEKLYENLISHRKM